MTTRRNFITQTITGAAAFAALPAIDAFAIDANPNEVPLLRFALMSDLHYGQPGTKGKEDLGNMINWLNDNHAKDNYDFVIVNGDLVHDQPELLSEVKSEYFDKLKCPHYAVPGNHDHADAALWKKVFGYEDNFVIEKRGVGLVFGNTTDVTGGVIGPDISFLKRSLDAFADKKVVFVVLHVPPARTENSSYDSPETVKLLNSYPNVKAVFCGHDHQQDGQKQMGNIPCFFDSHVGGNWGTDYRGYREVSVWFNLSITTTQVNPGLSPFINSQKLNAPGK
ncbi:MAG: metallophosphoesterase [Mucilaginibacter sp.]